MKLLVRVTLIIVASFIYVIILHTLSYKLKWGKRDQPNSKEENIDDVNTTRIKAEEPPIPRLIFNCSNIETIEIERKLGSGNFKTAFLGDYHGLKVAVKVVTPDQEYVKGCVQEMQKCQSQTSYNIQRCHGAPNMKLLKEILLMQELAHPNLINLLGFCVRSQNIASSSNVYSGGIFGVFEYGENIGREFLTSASWSQSINHAVELANLLKYFQHSPIGSIRNPDIKISQFCTKDNRIKMSDVDGFVYDEQKCGVKACIYDLECQNGKCIGANAKYLLERFRETFFLPLLESKNFPPEILPGISRILKLLNSLEIDATQLESQLQSLSAVSTT